MVALARDEYKCTPVAATINHDGVDVVRIILGIEGQVPRGIGSRCAELRKQFCTFCIGQRQAFVELIFAACGTVGRPFALVGFDVQFAERRNRIAIGAG